VHQALHSISIARGIHVDKGAIGLQTCHDPFEPHSCIYALEGIDGRRILHGQKDSFALDLYNSYLHLLSDLDFVLHLLHEAILDVRDVQKALHTTSITRGAHIHESTVRHYGCHDPRKPLVCGEASEGRDVVNHSGGRLFGQPPLNDLIFVIIAVPVEGRRDSAVLKYLVDHPSIPFPILRTLHLQSIARRRHRSSAHAASQDPPATFAAHEGRCCWSHMARCEKNAGDFR